MSTVGFIPVRAGSKGIPGKNSRLLGGKPLVMWVVEAASASGVLDEVVVATDDPKIRQIVEASSLPRVTVVNRAASHATDTASTESVMLEYADRAVFDTFVLLQATSPLTTPQDIQEALALFREAGADSLVSAARQRRFIWEVAGQFAKAINYQPSARPRRQDFDGYLVENGAITVCSRAGLIREGVRLHGNVVLYEMPEETFIELDEPADWVTAESVLAARSPQAVKDPVAALRGIDVLLTDVDGVLTDAGMYYTESGDELKKFNTRDGRGLELVRSLGVQTGIITSEDTRMVDRRAKKLKVDFLYQGVASKYEVLLQLSELLHLEPTRFAYVGDDLNDLEIMRHVGFAACPADARPEVKAIASHICATSGGEGVVREVCDLICESRQPVFPA